MKEIPLDFILRKNHLLTKIKHNQNECWEWTGEKSRLGYGVYLGFRVHRIFYAIYYKDPLDKIVCHTCDNPPCCNPKHLFLGTPKQNTQDMISKNRHKKWEHFEKSNVLTKELFEKIIIEYHSGKVSMRELSTKYNVTGLSRAFKRMGIATKVRGKKLGEDDIIAIRKLRREGVSARNISIKFGVHPYSIIAICSGRRWGSVKTAYDDFT